MRPYHRQVERQHLALPRLVIFDLDGVVYRGSQPIAGAAELVAALRLAGSLVRFATNNSMSTREAYVQRLSGQGIPTSEDEIVTSTWATIQHLRAREPQVHRVMTVGADGMLDELRAAGFDATYVGDAAGDGWAGEPLAQGFDAVVVGLDQRIDYRRLGIAVAAIRTGARFVATNADVRYPVPGGFIPGAGAIVAALQAASGVEPSIIGKPQPAMFEAILQASGIDAADALVIGDNADADVVAARRAGIPVCLMLTGVTSAEMAASLSGERRPDWIAPDPAAVAERLGLPLS
jgi:4-nitrophenyl phosphatase